MRRLRGSDDGTVAIIVAVSTTLLFGLLAITVDLGLLRVERGGAQNAADNAALAAAWASCNGADDDDAEDRGVAVAEANLEDDENVVVGRDPAERTHWKAKVDVEINSVFAPAIEGPSTLETGAVAVARCEPPGPGLQPALFASGKSCDDDSFVIEGAGNAIEGDVHSNDEMTFGGSANSVAGLGTYVDEVEDPERITWTPAEPNPTEGSVVAPPPLEFAIGAYQPGGDEANAAGPQYYDAGTADIAEAWLTSHSPPLYAGGTIEPGLYYTSGDITLPPIAQVAGGGGVTFVSEGGRVTFGAAGGQLEPFTDDLLMFSAATRACDEAGIVLNGSDDQVTGVLYAPGSRVVVGGSSNDLFGTVIARSILVTGSANHVESVFDGPPRPPGLTLVK